MVTAYAKNRGSLPVKTTADVYNKRYDIEINPGGRALFYSGSLYRLGMSFSFRDIPEGGANFDITVVFDSAPTQPIKGQFIGRFGDFSL